MSFSSQVSYNTDVLIVGAGPIGLTLACALRHHRVDCRIMEERTEPKPYSRANNFWARAQELLASVGVLDAVAEKSYRIDRINNFFNGKAVEPTKIDEVASPYPKVLYSGQDVIETALSSLAKAKGSPVERGCKVVAIAQDGEGVAVEFKWSETGSPHRLLKTAR